jgi:hypothetical protein
MATQVHEVPDGNYLEADGFTIWWSDTQPDRIHLTLSRDERFTDEHGGKPGIRVVFSSNPRSADYNPATFNRLARALDAAGKEAPAEVPVHSRKLADRPKVVAELLGESNAVPEPLLDFAALGWSTCPACFAVVVDSEGHAAACPATK